MAIQNIFPTGVLLLAGILGSQAQAQSLDKRPFPLEIQPSAVVAGTFEYKPVPGAFVDLMGRQALIMSEVKLPNGQSVDLDLTRVDANFQSMGVQVNGVPSPFDSMDLTLWRGKVIGSADSDVFLGFSSYGCNGWIRADGEYNHLMAFAGPGNDWSQAGARLVPDDVINSLGGARAKVCGLDKLVGGPINQNSPMNLPVGASGSQTFNSSARFVTLECKVAVETDYQYYQNWNNLQACQNYTATLLAEISDRYNAELDVVLTYPYLQFYTSSNDPWTSQGGGTSAVLSEFRNAWIGNIPAGANLAHFMSGANLGGGVAYLDALCSSSWGFGVSGDMDGGTQFPAVQSWNTWDFVVMAHEIGHNFGTGHTHDYCPPLDQCAPSGYFGQCQNSQVCVSNGTIMSYCHLCSGGMNNITTHFHPTVINAMRAGADSSCLQPYNGGSNCTADSMEPNDGCSTGNVVTTGTYTNLTACGTDADYYTINVANNEAVTFDLLFTDANGDIDCTLRSQFCITDLDSGNTTTNNESVTWTNTSGAAADVVLEVILYGGGTGPGNDYTMNVALTTIDPCAGVPDDSFENNDSCGTALHMADGVYPNLFVSLADSDFYELCVPGGGTLDVNALFTHSNGDVDTYLYSVNDCGGGTASNLAQGYSATDNEFISWTNPNPTNTTVIFEVRVYASSSSGCNSYDLVIAGADGNCAGPNSIGSLYCSPANINSFFWPAMITATGSQLAAANNVTLTVTQLPLNQFGYFINSQDQAYLPNPGGSMGNLCVGGPSGLGRHVNTLQYSGSAGLMTAAIDLTQIPTSSGTNISVVAGQTFNFQCWYRDFFITNTSNFSDAISITFH